MHVEIVKTADELAWFMRFR